MTNRESPPPPDNVEVRLEMTQKRSVNQRMLGVAASIPGAEAAPAVQKMVQKTIAEEMQEALERMEKMGCLTILETAIGSVGNLPRSIRSDWAGHLRSIKQYATRRNPQRGNGDPAAVALYIDNIDGEIQNLYELSASAAPSEQQAIQNILDAMASFRHAILPLPPAMLTQERAQVTRNRPVEERGSHLMRVAAFGALATATTIAGIIALCTDADKRNMTPTLIYMGLAGTVAGWSRLTADPTNQLGMQTAFLTDPGSGWEIFEMSGEACAQFVENYYQSIGRNRLIADFLHGRNPAKLQEQRAAILALGPSIQGQLTALVDSGSEAQRSAAILALAPQNIHEQLTPLLNSGNIRAHREAILALVSPELHQQIIPILDAAQGAGFRALTNLLNKASSRDARERVIRYVRSGASLQSLQAFNAPTAQAPGAPTAV